MSPHWQRHFLCLRSVRTPATGRRSSRADAESPASAAPPQRPLSSTSRFSAENHMKVVMKRFSITFLIRELAAILNFDHVRALKKIKRPLALSVLNISRYVFGQNDYSFILFYKILTSFLCVGIQQILELNGATHAEIDDHVHTSVK